MPSLRKLCGVINSAVFNFSSQKGVPVQGMFLSVASPHLADGRCGKKGTDTGVCDTNVPLVMDL